MGCRLFYSTIHPARVVAIFGVGLVVDGFAGVWVVAFVLWIGDGVKGEATHEGGEFGVVEFGGAAGDFGEDVG